MTVLPRVTQEIQCASCETALTVQLDAYHPGARLRQMYVCPACTVRREGTFPGVVVQLIRRREKVEPPLPQLQRPPRPSGIILTCYDSDRGPQSVGVVWTAKSRQLSMICTLLTHARGWEVRLAVRNHLIQSHVCRTEQAVFDTAEAWWADAIGKGWTDL